MPGARRSAASDVAARTGPAVDHAQLDLLRAAPERLVLVVEDPLHHVALAAEVDVRDLGLLLEHRAHQLRQRRVDVDDLLELVEDERHPPVALGGELGRAARAAARASRRCPRAGARAPKLKPNEPSSGLTVTVGWIRSPRNGASAASRRARSPRRRSRRSSGELLGQLLLGRGGHQVDLGDQHSLRAELLDRPPDQRRLAVAAGGEDDDVLAVAGVGDELGDLVLAVRERLVERQRAEAEGVRRDLVQHTERYYT